MLIIAAGLLMLLCACQNSQIQPDTSAESSSGTGQIYLYGEAHGVEKILNKELALWSAYYHNDGMRHLFIEFPYYTGELLNLWMQAENDDILNAIYADWANTAAQTDCEKEFFLAIKSQCPETVFHGTDVGHQYATTGIRFLNYLKKQGQEDSEQYQLTQQAIEQGKHFYKEQDEVYRENKMTENFVHTWNALENQSIMGIYGSAHTGLDAMNYTNAVPCMANQLQQLYGDAVHAEDLTWLEKDIEPLKWNKITVNGKEYAAAYFGEQNIAQFSEKYVSRAFWRLEDAYEDFAQARTTGDVLPHNNYPMLIEIGQVFVIDYTKTDGLIERMYYRFDNEDLWQGLLVTVGFEAE